MSHSLRPLVDPDAWTWKPGGIRGPGTRRSGHINAPTRPASPAGKERLNVTWANFQMGLLWALLVQNAEESRDNVCLVSPGLGKGRKSEVGCPTIRFFFLVSRIDGGSW